MSIKLNKQTHEKEAICTLIKQSILNPEYELECVVGGNYNLGSTISHQQFRKILSRVNGKREYQARPAEDKLVISFPRDTKFGNIRVIINGFGSINYYCINEKLDDIIHNVVFQEKQYVNEKLSKQQVPNYNIKFNQKSERVIETDTGVVRELLRDWRELQKIFRYKKTYRFTTMPDRMFCIDCSIVRSSGFEDRELTIREVLARDLFHNVIKPRDDKTPFGEWWKAISKTPDAMVKVRNVNVYYKTIKESRVFENDFLYEVEVEYNSMATTPGEGTLPKTARQEYTDAKDKDTYINGVFGKYFKQIGMILQCVQDSFYIMGNNEYLDVLGEYVKLTGVKKGMENLFFGPLPIEMDNNKLIEYPAQIYEDMTRVYENGNIIMDYCVTDKSDGTRCLLYLDGKGRCYLIGRDSTCPVRDMGVSMPAYANSVFDGEYIEMDKDDQFLNKYYIFDTYFVKGHSVMRRVFGRGREPGGRLWELTRFVELFHTGVGVFLQGGSELSALNPVATRYMFRVDKKSFFFGESSKTPSNIRNTNLIFEHCRTLLGKMNRKFGGRLEEGHMYTYKTDGLIFTPVELGVYQSSSENIVPESVLVSSRKWSQLFKWKSADQLSIDFRVDFPKDIKTKERVSLFIGTQKYVRCTLLCRNYDSHMWRNRTNIGGEAAGNEAGIRGNDTTVESAISSLLLNDGMSLYNMPDEVPFKAVYPFLGARDMDGNIQIMSHECLLKMEPNGDIKCINGDLIHQGSVVEFTYDIRDGKYDNEAMRWQPLKIRFGKVPNAMNTCIDIWNLVHNPVQPETISEGLTIDRMIDVKNINYYLHGRYLLTSGLKKFNNFVKGWLLERYMHSMSSPKVLDLACGKLGDYFKYANQGAGTLVGMDINPDNLNNKLDGAASRVLNAMSTNPRAKALAGRTLLILGDIAKNLADGSAATDELGRYYLDILYGRHKPSTNFNAKHAKFFNLGTDGFHIVVCNYAIHYALDDFQGIANLLENVGQNLRDQGYFIGTCLDGNLVLDELNKAGGYLEGRVNGHTVWSIDRRSVIASGRGAGGVIYEDNGQVAETQMIDQYSTDMPHMLGPGNKVDMYFETMNTISHENLVDIKYVEQQAHNHRLKLVDTRLFTETPGSLLAEWENSDAIKSAKSVGRQHQDSDTATTTGDSTKQTVAQMIEEIKKEKALAQWAKFQRYFVFQKIPAE